MRKFYSCSVGEKGKGYDEKNLKKIIENKAFILHESTPQKGDYQNIKENDILLLKYRGNFIAYGEALTIEKTTDEEWNLFAPVAEWFFHDASKPSSGTDIYGMKDATLGGSQYGTVKPLDADFALKKIKKINKEPELFTTILLEFKKDIDNKNMQDKIDLLKYKKQIILQGPPGTGKTRLAKELAKSFVVPNEKIDIQYFKEIVLTLESFKSRLNENSIVIESVKDEMIYFEGSKSVSKYNFTIKDLYDCYTNNDYLGSNFVQYPQYAKRSLVWYVIDELHTANMDDQCKLIQFHPSYTYEDFVRGIISVPNEDGEGVLFKTENKILAGFAEKALKNKLDSQKGATELSKEKWINEQFDKFLISVSETLESEEKIELTESVVIVEIDEDAFRYKGIKGWSKKGNRMLFKDIKRAYLDENFERQDLKHNNNLSGLAKWHASYYVRVLDMFKFFLKENKIDFITNTTLKEELKNYVLIIDEINRANLPSVLGELIYALEYRDEPVDSMYEYEKKREIILPSNLYIIGTMNTADRSVGHIDYAIKRRFAFVDILPTDQAIDDVVTDLDLNAKAKGLYHKVAELFNEDKTKNVYLQSDFKAKDVQLGHSYFLVENEKQLQLKLEFEIKPLLNEYVKDGILGENALAEINAL